jgi:manganese oxidase
VSSDLVSTPAGSRREFLKRGTTVAIGLPAVLSTLGACSDKAAEAAQPTTPAAPAAPPSPRQRADLMDAMHEKGVKAFPAKTAGKGNQLLKPRIEKGVKVFDLTAEEIQWEVEPGRKVKAWAYNGQVPGLRSGCARATGCG